MRLRVEDRRLWHDPRRRQCSLASITTIRYEGEKIRSISYTGTPTADLIPSRRSEPAGA